MDNKNRKTMENIITMNKIWAYLQSFSLSSNNREWLIGKLQEPSATKAAETEEDIRKRVDETHKMLFKGTVTAQRAQEYADFYYEEPKLEPYTIEELYARVDQAEREFERGEYYTMEEADAFVTNLINSMPDKK